MDLSLPLIMLVSAESCLGSDMLTQKGRDQYNLLGLQGNMSAMACNKIPVLAISLYNFLGD